MQSFSSMQSLSSMQSFSSMASRAVALVAAAIIALALLAAPAAAHSQLTGSEPAAGSSVQAPAQVRLEFNEALITLGTQLSVTDSAGVVTELEARYPEPHIAAADLPRLPAGPTAVTWRVVSSDGHPIEGVLEFDVTEPDNSQPAPAEPSAVPEATVTTSASAIAVTSEVPDPAPGDVPMPDPSGGLPWWMWAALAAAIAGATGIAVWDVRRR